MGGEVERAVIRVGGCLGCLSWQRGSQPPLWEGGLACRVTGSRPTYLQILHVSRARQALPIDVG